jgi:adenylate cyclase
VASSVAGVIEPALQAAETARSAGRPTTDLTAYDLYLRAHAMFWPSVQVPEALRLLEQAIARDPRYGPALAWAANCYRRLVVDGRSENPETDRLKGADFARRALAVAGDDPVILANAALALAYFGEDIGAHWRSTRTTRGAGSSAACSGFMRASRTSRSTMSKPRCASVPAPVLATRS